MLSQFQEKTDYSSFLEKKEEKVNRYSHEDRLSAFICLKTMSFEGNYVV